MRNLAMALVSLVMVLGLILSTTLLGAWLAGQVANDLWGVQTDPMLEELRGVDIFYQAEADHILTRLREATSPEQFSEAEADEDFKVMAGRRTVEKEKIYQKYGKKSPVVRLGGPVVLPPSPPAGAAS